MKNTGIEGKCAICEEDPYIYTQTKLLPEGYVKLEKEKIFIGQTGYGKDAGTLKKYDITDYRDFSSLKYIMCFDERSIYYFSSKNEFILEREEQERKYPEIIQIVSKGQYKNERANLICNGNNIKVITNPGTSDESVIDYNRKEKIETIDTYGNCIVINGSNIILIDQNNKDNLVSIFENVENFKNENFENLSSKDFIENDNGCFCIVGLSEEEKLKLYKEKGFTKLYEELIEEIDKRKEEEKAKEEKINKVNDYLEGKVFSLCHIRKRSGFPQTIVEADNIEFVENDNTVKLYEIQCSGWSYGTVYETGIINVEEAKKNTKMGKLHLDIPEEHMGKIIGHKGSNINAVTEQLRQKGVDVSKIILHPKSKEEIKITLEKIEEAVKKQRSQTFEDK